MTESHKIRAVRMPAKKVRNFFYKVGDGLLDQALQESTKFTGTQVVQPGDDPEPRATHEGDSRSMHIARAEYLNFVLHVGR
jgi:hypothetical protein